MKVFVLNEDGSPLMPTTRAGWVRRMLRDKKAKVVRKCPFTIKLVKQIKKPVTQKLVLGIDPGSKTMGTCVRKYGSNEVVYASEVHLRQNIKDKMKRRSAYRRNRRTRNLRYRQPRFLNRTSRARQSGEWLPSSVKSKVDSTLKEIRFVLALLPVSKVKHEYSSFDIHKLVNPKVKGHWYSKGPRYHYSNLREFVLSRDHHKCQICKGKSGEPVLNIHHVQHRSEGGKDHQNNLLTTCIKCHKDYHQGNKKITKPMLKNLGKQVRTLDATQVSIITKRIQKFLKTTGLKTVKTYGYLTKKKRKRLSLPKAHKADAFAISCPLKPRMNKPRLPMFFRKKCVARGDYQLSKGVRSQQRIPTGKLFGFRKFDKVNYQGTEYFVKGRMSSGYFILADSNLEQAKLKPIPKPALMKRVQARSSWITFQRMAVNS